MRTKPIYRLHVMFLLLILLGSCEKLLDQKPQAAIAADEAITNPVSARAAIIGVYANLASGYGQTYTIFPDLLADNLAHNGSFVTLTELDNHTYLPDNSSAADLWRSLYRGINRANYVLEQVPAINDPAFSDQKSIMAEARFMRALNYFHLVRYWGDVPLMTTPTKTTENILVSRTPQEQVYALIRSDLQEATPDLPDKATGRATKWAAKALMARVALHLQDYATAAALSAEIIDSKQFSLVANYRLLFATKNTPESIFELQYDPVSANGLAFWFLPTSLGGRNEVGPRGAKATLESAYEPGDTRKEASISPGGLLLDGRLFPAGTGIKYYRSNRDDNVLVIRHAEVLLTRAEALAQLGNLQESLALLNQIRQRAGLQALSIEDQPGLLQAIEQERRVELAMEGHRWFDLIRTGRAQQVLAISDPNKLLLPIPQEELLLNPNLTQNEGY